MNRKPAFIAAFLLTTFMSVAQDNYDTLLIYHYFAEYTGDPTPPPVVYRPVHKFIREYDLKGRVTIVSGFEYDDKNPNPYYYYQETYKYGPNDSLLTITIYEVPPGKNDFKLRAFTEYFYKDNLLSEIKTTKYAHSEKERLNNHLEAWYWRRDGGSTSDTSGWKTISAIRYSYGDQRKLLKKAMYRDYADKTPENLWVYTYGSNLPDINSYYQNVFTLKNLYSHFYKNGQLKTYREARRGHQFIDVDVYDYSHNKNGEVVELVASEMKLYAKKDGGPYKLDGKEQVTNKEEYKYKDGRLSSKVVHYRSSYTKYKLSFLDRLGNMPSTSTSTTRYGDYQTTTTTTTYNKKPLPPKEDMVAKTKYKWNSYTIEYEYDANGKRMVKGGSQYDGKHFYDSKGRLFMYVNCEEKDLYDGRPTCVKYWYSYRKDRVAF
jgi:hypothetical protein